MHRLIRMGGIERLPQAVRRLRVAVAPCRSFSDGPDKPKRPKLVVFDLGGVVLQSPIPAITKFEAESGVPAGSIFSAAKKMGDGGAFPRLERGELTLEEFIPEFRKEISEAGVVLKKDVADMFVAMEAGFAPPRPEMLLAIQSLKAEGIRTAALTNNWKRNNGATLPPSLASTMKLFDVVVESALVGLRKPVYHFHQRFHRKYHRMLYK
jgi:acyl-CoA dehydrogenase family member 10